MEHVEKRRHKRLGVDLCVACRRVGVDNGKVHSGRAVNASPGGVYLKTRSNEFRPGDLVEVELTVLPKPGLLERVGRISGFGRVIRTDDLANGGVHDAFANGRYGVALEFCRGPKLAT